MLPESAADTFYTFWLDAFIDGKVVHELLAVNEAVAMSNNARNLISVVKQVRHAYIRLTLHDLCDRDSFIIQPFLRNTLEVVPPHRLHYLADSQMANTHFNAYNAIGFITDLALTFGASAVYQEGLLPPDAEYWVRNLTSVSWMITNEPLRTLSPEMRVMCDCDGTYIVDRKFLKLIADCITTLHTREAAGAYMEPMPYNHVPIISDNGRPNRDINSVDWVLSPSLYGNWIGAQYRTGQTKWLITGVASLIFQFLGVSSSNLKLSYKPRPSRALQRFQDASVWVNSTFHRPVTCVDDVAMEADLEVCEGRVANSVREELKSIHATGALSFPDLHIGDRDLEQIASRPLMYTRPASGLLGYLSHKPIPILENRIAQYEVMHGFMNEMTPDNVFRVDYDSVRIPADVPHPWFSPFPLTRASPETLPTTIEHFQRVIYTLPAHSEDEDAFAHQDPDYGWDDDPFV